MLHDTVEGYEARAVQVAHACGHTFTHMVPQQLAPDRLLSVLTDSMAGQPCPACIQGVPDWAIDPVARAPHARDCGVS
jgi:hypothetical protein